MALTEFKSEPLAEIHLLYTPRNLEDSSKKHTILCLCTRVFIKNNFDVYASTLEREEISEVDDFLEKENVAETTINEADRNLIPISKNTEKIIHTHNTANCEGSHTDYFSASHTDEHFSTDEHESIFHTKILHSSDSGADISEQNLIIEKRLESIEKRNYKTDAIKETCESNNSNDASPTDNKLRRHERNNSLPELFANDELLCGWEKYWSKNGEGLIWASWIEKYSDYINPEYLPKDKETDGDDVTAPSTSMDLQKSTKFSFEPQDVDMTSSIEKEFTTSSPARNARAESMSDGWNPLSPLSIDDSSYRNPKTSTSQHQQHENDTLLSPRCESVTSSIPFTLDSMTNVTHMTISSYDFCSSRVSSESSISSVSSESYSDTEDAAFDEDDEVSKYDHPTVREDKKALITNSEDNTMDVDQYWQMLWQKHFQEQYASHYQEFISAHRNLQEDMSSSFHSESGGFLGKNLKPKVTKKRRANRGKRNQESLQKMVANLNLVAKQGIFGQKYQKTSLKTQESQKIVQENLDNSVKSKNADQLMDSDGNQKRNKSDNPVTMDNDNAAMSSLGLPTSFGRQLSSKRDNDDDDKEFRRNRSGNLKRIHESDPEESNLEKIKSNFEMMGFYFGDQDNAISSGDIVYRKKHVRLHNRMLKMNFQQQKPKHIYFDEDGNEISDTTNEGEGVTAACVIHSSSDEDIPPSVIPSRINSINFTQQLSSDANMNEDEVSGKINLNSSIDQENESNCVEEPTNFDDDVPMTNAKKEKKKKRKSKFSSNIPAEIASDKSLKKFWYKRFSLFSMYDLGIKLDRESWFSVTPEKVATYTAERCRTGLIIDAFCGCGGNAIQFAKTCDRVIAIDIDPKKIEMAKHNATIYGVADKIEFIVGNYLHLYEKLKADVVFLSPPWGGPQYMNEEIYDLEKSLLPVPASELIEKTRTITNDIAFYVPRNTNTSKLAILAGKNSVVEIEQNFLDRKLVALTAYYGNLINY